ncbi:MAG: SpoVG family protein [Planctomycetota bacterium]
MEITDVKVKLASDRKEKLTAFCTVTINNAFVVRDLKVIKGTTGYFIAMPSQKIMDRCPACGGKNHLRARFCNDCGGHLPEDRAPKDERGRSKLHLDIAHPINAECRALLQQKIIEAYEAEAARAGEKSDTPPEEAAPADPPAPEIQDFEEYEKHASPEPPPAPKHPLPRGEFTNVSRRSSDFRNDRDSSRRPPRPPRGEGLPRPATESLPPTNSPSIEPEPGNDVVPDADNIGNLLPRRTERRDDRPLTSHPVTASAPPPIPLPAPKPEKKAPPEKDNFGAGIL